ncbi:GntR family transcriptional regulator [Microvirga massiliensis]|uniref:GntR family transcriptional regulator n=1 Tax=Microvirga massiliensis TaxID=1033741 RepID=UPI00062BA363|nr:GntR family transcriptional regulator [Microvirga massiliensis]
MSLSPSRSTAADRATENGWQPLRPKTLVDMVVDAVVAAAARGLILPGDRIVESDVAQRLAVSRVPVREALRLLESQGVVINEPYKGIRLTPFTAERMDNLIEARVALETAAASRAIRDGHNGGAAIETLLGHVSELEAMAARGDTSGFANADTNFHRALCALSGNDVICNLWEGLARQATIFFGLSALRKPMDEIIDEHRTLIAVFSSGDVEAMTLALDDHIRAQTHAVDFAAIIHARRAERAASGG